MYFKYNFNLYVKVKIRLLEKVAEGLKKERNFFRFFPF